MWDVAPRSPKMAPEEIHLWRFDLDRNHDAFRDLERTLDAAELARASRMRRPRERSRYILGRWGLRTILACYLKANPAEVVFGYGPLGKPELHNGELHFNVSHSEDVILYALSSRHGVGVDVERVVSGRDQEITRHFLPRSMRRLTALPVAERRDAFCRGWTRMEAYAKLSGRGLESELVDFDDFMFLVPVRGHQSCGTYRIDDWSIYDLRPRKGYVAAVAGPTNCKLKCWRWQAKKPKTPRWNAETEG